MKKGQIPFARYGPVVAYADFSQLAKLGVALAKMMAAGAALEAASFSQELLLPVGGGTTSPGAPAAEPTTVAPRGPTFTVKVQR